MVRQHYENAIKNIQAEKERAIAQAKDRVTREKILPHNAEVNQDRDKALAELSSQLNADIAKLQEKFNIEKQALIDVGEKNKTDFANAAIETEVALVSMACDQAISDLQTLISKLKE